MARATGKEFSSPPSAPASSPRLMAANLSALEKSLPASPTHLDVCLSNTDAMTPLFAVSPLSRAAAQAELQRIIDAVGAVMGTGGESKE